MLAKFLKNLRSIQQKVFEDSTELYQFLKIYFYVLAAALIISIFGGFYAFLFISGFGLIISILAFLGIKIFSTAAGSLYSGSKEKDHKSILRGMYGKAEGQVLSAQFSQAEKVYKELLKEYPKELDAHYYLGRLYLRQFNDKKKSLEEFSRLKQKIKEQSVDYDYKDAVEENIKNLRSELNRAQSNL